MSESSLERIKELAQQLTSDDRKQLLNFLAALPDSGVASDTGDPPSPLLSTEDRKKVENSAGENRLVFIYNKKTHASVFMRGRVIFTLFFYPENFRQSRREMALWKDRPPREEDKEQIRRLLILMTGGKTEITEDQVLALYRLGLPGQTEDEGRLIANTVGRLLPTMAWLLVDGGMTIVGTGYQNMVAGLEGQPKKTLAEILPHLEPYWARIKKMLNVTPGGRRHFKHTWGAADPFCLTHHHERLKPIWREAKRAAKQAQKSKEPNRRNRWKEAIAATYQAEDLPSDLVDLLELPQATSPSELALQHAARICIPDARYSTRVLKEKLLPLKRPA